jgi:HD-like signal output (HDOD) protein
MRWLPDWQVSAQTLSKMRAIPYESEESYTLDRAFNRQDDMDSFDSQIKTLTEDIEDELKGGNLTFPTVFDLSLRIKEVADDPGSSLQDMAKIVSAEPVLSARVMKMANSVLLNPYQREVTSVSAAISRIGSSSLRCLAYAVAADQLARDHRTPRMRMLATDLWRHSIDVAAWSYAFARHYKLPSPDAALLAGLMVSIGHFYLLAKATRHPALESEIERFAEFVLLWDEPVKRAVLEALELPLEIIEASDLSTGSSGENVPEWPPQTLAEVVFLATLAAETENPFAVLLNIRRRPELLEASLGEQGHQTLEQLLETARQTRDEMLAAAGS